MAMARSRTPAEFGRRQVARILHLGREVIQKGLNEIKMS